MKARPILFSAPMVQALLAGSKTQTRRLIKPQPHSAVHQDCETGEWGQHWYSLDDRGDPTVEHWRELRCPYGKPGGVLWARENLQAVPGRTDPGLPTEADFVLYPADHHERVIENSREAADQWLALYHYDDKRRAPGSVVPSIHMPTWASRLTLAITDVRVERLQDISEADARAEGIIEYDPTEEDPSEFSYVDGGDIWNNARSAYAALWEAINGRGSWDANPWVWAVSFEVHRQNVDALLQARAA